MGYNLRVNDPVQKFCLAYSKGHATSEQRQAALDHLASHPDYVYRPSIGTQYDKKYNNLDLISDPESDRHFLPNPFSKKIQTDLTFSQHDSYQFYDTYHGLPRFNLVFQGVRGFGNRIHSFNMDGTIYSLEQMKAALRAQQLVKPFRSVRLISSYTGTGGTDSMVHWIAQDLKMPVKGYMGEVAAVTPAGAREAKRALPNLDIPVGVLKSAVYVKGDFRNFNRGVIAGFEYFNFPPEIVP